VGWNFGCGELLFFSLFVPFIIVVVGFLNDFFGELDVENLFFWG
jgi:hypothetical protein